MPSCYEAKVSESMILLLQCSTVVFFERATANTRSNHDVEHEIIITPTQ